MARIPDAELERLKAEVSVERLVEASGVALKPSGKDRLGVCPFHEDGEPSLVVTPEKNLWHCFGCGAAGGPIDWVMRKEGISFRHAVELLRKDIPGGGSASTSPWASGSTLQRERASGGDMPSPRTTRALPAPVGMDADDQAVLRQVVGFYHETLKASPEALDYLKARGIYSEEAVARFQLGYANRTLGYSLPVKQVKAGAEIRGRLTRIGLYRESGHEHFSGSLVIPVMDEAGNVSEVYGRKLLDNLRKGTPKHLYLPGPHKGVWNVEGLRDSKEVILCEALIDALTFWCAGFRNVTAAYGVEGFTNDHLEAFEKAGVERVLIANDRDDAGERAAEKLAHKLMERGFACYRVQFPKGMDANEYALKVAPAAKSLGLAIRAAAWMGIGAAPKRPETQAEPISEALPPLAAQAFAIPAPPAPEPGGATPEPTPGPSAARVPPSPGDHSTAAERRENRTGCAADGPEGARTGGPSHDLAFEIQGQDLLLALGSRAYRVRGWQKPLSPELLKVNLLVSKGEAFHVDTLDLYQAKARTAFIRQAGLELGESEDALKLDLGKVLRKVEALQGDALAQALAEKQARPAMIESEHAEALGLLKAPDLLPRILADFEALGVVGEEANKLTGYLAAVSRLLDRPLALLIQSASAAGKSSLMDAVLDLVPEEDVVRYSAMSGQSVFYMGDKGLQHRILAIAEEEGAKQASYALKLLQSEGRVTMASTGKNPATGMLETHDYTVEGPVMLFLTTTAIDLDEELLNRCLVLTVNESRGQTRAIHALQRDRETLERLLVKRHREELRAVHRNAQRLLQPLEVVNPFAHQLRFRDDQVRSRRDHVKYLTLIRAIALLHQYQRDVKSLQHGGQTVRYIEVIPEDIRLANELAEEVFSRTVDELMPQTRKLLTLLHAWVREACEREDVAQCDFHFTRRQARETTGWGDTQLKTHLDRLVELEFLVAHRGRQGSSYSYELIYQGEGEDGRAKLLGLINPDTLQPPPDARSAGACSRAHALAEVEPPAMTATSRGQASTSRGEGGDFSAPSRGLLGGFSAPSRGEVIPLKPNGEAGLNGCEAEESEKTHTGNAIAVPSYLNGVAR